eukprot:gb/GECH01006758.1/.p1 GENE.gb/GECH01006758.1/~~gb/GECH01006758.1/.p1  ORF type:complete len:359 (+),score=53.97 gb/GECH01006758.1/:1-1077(+)
MLRKTFKTSSKTTPNSHQYQQKQKQKGNHIFRMDINTTAKNTLWKDITISGNPSLNVATSHTDSSGTPLILVHGISATSRHWNSFARKFPTNIPPPPLYALDLRGRGGSEIGGPQEKAGLKVHVEDIRRVMDYFNLPKAVIVGHSLGGYIALEGARVLGERCAGYVVVDSGHPADWGSPVSSDPQVVAALERSFQRLSMRFSDINTYLKYWFPCLPNPVENLPADWVNTFAYELVPSSSSDQENKREEKMRVAVDEQSVKADAADLPNSRMTLDQIRQLQTPALLLTAEYGFTDHTPPFVDENVANMLNTNLNCEYPAHRIKGSNHYTILTEPRHASELAQHVASWLNNEIDKNVKRK